jgi:hypothetical protein
MSVIVAERTSQPSPTTSAEVPSAPIAARLSEYGALVLCGCPIVAKTAIQAIGAAKMAEIAVHFCDRRARDQKKLFPHFGEAGTAVFSIEEIKDGGHDRPPSFDHHHAIISLGMQYVI